MAKKPPPKKRKPAPRKALPENRTADGRFLPGHSGNPGGRPVVIREAKNKAEAHCPEAIDRLWQIASDTKVSASTRVYALAQILDRGMGKPRQQIDLKTDPVNVVEYQLVQQIIADPRLAELADTFAGRLDGNTGGAGGAPDPTPTPALAQG